MKDPRMMALNSIMDALGMEDLKSKIPGMGKKKEKDDDDMPKGGTMIIVEKSSKMTPEGEKLKGRLDKLKKGQPEKLK